jgi:hypothetical protein
LLVALAWRGDGGQAPRTPWEFDPATLKPFTVGEPYLGQHATGLYPGGKNDIPEAHQRAGLRVAAAIRPLGPDGQPDDEKGRILALVLGHSNCAMYFGAFGRHLKAHAAELHPRFELVNAAVGGQQLPQIRQFKGGVWDKAAKMLAGPSHTPKQVQVLFLHTTWHGAGNFGMPPGPFPGTMQQMERALAEVLEHCLEAYPNLRLAYLTCDGLRHFTRFEPHVWQEAFAFKWLIEKQIKGEESTAFEDKEGRPRRLPWLQWGPYIWDNTWDRSYFVRDGVHPGEKALDLFVRKYWDFLKADPVARPWLLKP